MAQLPLPSTALGNFTASLSAPTSFGQTAAVKEFDGTPVDLSAWNAINAILVGPNGLAQNYNSSVTASGNADGTIDLTIDPSALITSPATYQMVVTGKVLVGDAEQLLGTGTLQVGV